MGFQSFKGFSKKLSIAIITTTIIGAIIFLAYISGCIPVAPQQTAPPGSDGKEIGSPDSDGDGIPDVKEVEYGTDPYKPNYLFAYALKKLSGQEALKFKNVESFDANSISLVDLYASLPQYKRALKEVEEFLELILSDGKINELEKNLFEDKFVFPTPPSIKRLSWVPTRENLDKIYDISVTFTARDDRTPIAYAELRFIPVEYYYMVERYGMRPEDYPKVFPPDKEKIFVLTPIDGNFDSLEESFSIQITNITGGREYKIVVLVRDLAGNNKTIDIKTPYIRRYENLGKLLYENGFIVMSIYLPFNMRDIPHKDDVSLLGKYDTLDKIVIAKHVDWAAGYGINTFILDSQNHWWSTTHMKYRVFSICKILLSLNQIKVAWLVGPSRYDFVYGKYGGEIPEWAIDLKNPRNNSTFLRFVDALMNSDIVNNPNYLKIYGKPVLYIWDEGAFFNQEETYIAVKRLAASRTGSEAYIIADWIPRIPTQPSDGYVQFLLEKFRGGGLRVVDAFTGWIGFHRVGLDTQEYVDNYEYYYEVQLNAWRNFTNTWGKDFVVTLTPGFDNSYSWGGPQIPLPRGINKFTERLKIAIRYLNSPHQMLKIDTWNDFGEWTYVEPTRKEGFAYLEVLRDVFVRLAIDKTPPSISNLNWTPTRVVLDKIYDINVTFKAIDYENPIAYAELRFIPVEYYYMIEGYGMRPEDYPKVFPPDSERVFVLNPVDGKFDSLEEEFSVSINDIVGGREYRIVALVRDLAGNERTVEIKTPYIRQFENFSKTDEVFVLAAYYPWYNPSHWREGYKEKPLLGLYYSQDGIVLNKHIDWATGHGIDGFVISWWGPYSFEDTTIKNLLKCDLIKDIKFVILYESLGRLKYSKDGDISINLSDSYNRAVLVNDFTYLNENYFKHPSYMKIDEKPAVFIYLTRVFTGDIAGAINNLRKTDDIFLIGDEVYWQDPRTSEVMERIKLYDGITAYNMHTNIGSIIENFETRVFEKYREWLEVVKSLDRYFIPSSIPGFDDRAVRTGNIPIPRSVERFERELAIALSTTYSVPKMILITSFNEWHEDTQIEPSVSYGFDYLKVLKLYLESLNIPNGGNG